MASEREDDEGRRRMLRQKERKRRTKAAASGPDAGTEGIGKNGKRAGCSRFITEGRAKRRRAEGRSQKGDADPS